MISGIGLSMAPVGNLVIIIVIIIFPTSSTSSNHLLNLSNEMNVKCVKCDLDMAIRESMAHLVLCNV